MVSLLRNPAKAAPKLTRITTDVRTIRKRATRLLSDVRRFDSKDMQDYFVGLIV